MDAHKRLDAFQRNEDFNELQVKIAFFGQHRQLGKTSFTFKSVNINHTVADQLKKWLKGGINQIMAAYTNFETDPTSQPDEVSLDDLDNWSRFETFLKNPTLYRPEELLQKIANDAVGYAVYITHNNFMVGYFRRLAKKNILKQSGRYMLFISGTTLSHIKEQRGIVVDSKCDFVFLVDGKGKAGWVLNSANYEKFFDIEEKRKREAVKFAQGSPLLGLIEAPNEIISLVGTDRGLQRQLLSPNVQKGMGEFNFSNLSASVTALKSAGVELHFGINNGSVEFTENNKRRAISQLLGIVGYRYSRSLMNNHLVESSSVKLLT